MLYVVKNIKSHNYKFRTEDGQYKKVKHVNPGTRKAWQTKKRLWKSAQGDSYANHGAIRYRLVIRVGNSFMNLCIPLYIYFFYFLFFGTPVFPYLYGCMGVMGESILPSITKYIIVFPISQ